MAIESPLERRVLLSELLDLGAFREICAAATSLLEVGVTLCGPAGQPLAQTGGAKPGIAAACAQWPDPGACLIASTEAGVRYHVRAVEHAAETVGTIVLGPYRAGADGDPRLPRLDDQAVAALAQMLERAASAMAAAGHARRLTSDMHEATQVEYFRELEDKNRRLSDMLDRLREVDRLKSSFLSTVSHELRTPLTSVIGYSEMLLEGLAGDLLPEQREYVRTIMDKGDQLLTLISGILEISRIEAGAMALSRVEVDPVGLVVEVAASMRGHANRKNVELKTEGAPDLPRILADHDKLRQAVANVIGNAIKFTPSGGHVEVSVRAAARPARTIEISVVDDGIGIPPSALPHVFDAFFQADSSPTREHGGAGLGLYIAKSFVEAHGGTIALSAAPGQGTRVVMRLPLSKPPEGGRGPA